MILKINEQYNRKTEDVKRMATVQAAQLLHLKLLNDFGGECRYNPIKKNRYEFIMKLYEEENELMKLRDYCEEILYNENADVNINILNNLLFHLMNESPEKVTALIYILIYELARFVKVVIQNDIEEEKFTVASFIKKLNIYNENIKRLHKNVEYYTKNVRRGETNYSQVTLMGNYMFYANVCNVKYKVRTEEKYMTQLLEKMIVNTTIKEIMPVFKLYKYYMRLSYAIKDKREKLFNVAIDDSLIQSMGSNQKFVKSYVEYIHGLIIEEKKDKKQDTTKKERQEEIEMAISVSTLFREREMFNIYYRRYLENRLLKSNVNLELENYLLDKFNKKDSKIIEVMKYQIDDIKAGKNIMREYKTCKFAINETSEFYGKVDKNKLNRELLHVKILRHQAWHDSEKIEYATYKTPLEILPQIRIYEGIFKKKHKYRTIRWNFNMGTAIIKLTFENNNKKEVYRCKVTLPQLFVLLQLKKGAKSANEISEEVGIKLGMLGDILNMFAKTKIGLLTREPGEANDANLKFQFNKKFRHRLKQIDLSTLMKSQSIANDNKIKEEFALGRDNILMARIVNIVKQRQTIASTELLTEAHKKIPFKPTDTLYNNCVLRCIKDGYIAIKKDNTIDEEKNVVYQYADIEKEKENEDAIYIDEISSEEEQNDKISIKKEQKVTESANAEESVNIDENANTKESANADESVNIDESANTDGW